MCTEQEILIPRKLRGKVLLSLVGWAMRAFPWASYLGMVYSAIDPSCRVVIDMGCGRGAVMNSLRQIDGGRRLGYCVGLDLSLQSVSIAKPSYDDILVADVRSPPFRERSAGTVLCLDVIEHLDKSEGRKVIDLMETIARGTCVFFTPVGPNEQPATPDNPYQEHKSSWFPSDFESRGYIVRGARGVRAIYVAGCRYRWNGKALRPLLHLVRFISKVFIYMLPSLSYQMLCVKRIAPLVIRSQRTYEK
jgi:hypothetical protein